MSGQKRKKNSRLVRLFRRALYEFAKWTGAIVIGPFMRIKRHYAYGKMPKGTLKAPALLASNHLTQHDPLILMSAFPTKKIGFLVADEVFEHYGGGFLRAVGAIPIARENPKLSTIKESKARFRAGDLICIFAEGRLPLPHETLEVRPFKEGGAFIAAIAGVDVIPVFIAPRVSYWHRQHVVVGRRMKLSEYITTVPPKIDEISAFSEAIRQEIAALRMYYYNLPKMKAKNKEEMDNRFAKRPPVWADDRTDDDQKEKITDSVQVLSDINHPEIKNNTEGETEAMQMKVEKNYFEQIVTAEEFKKMRRHKNAAQLMRYMSEEFSALNAVKNSQAEYSYERLIADAGSVAGVIRNAGIQKGDHVAIFADNNYAFVKSALGIMAYGAVAVLLPMQLPDKALIGCCRKFDVKALVYEPKLKAVVDAVGNGLSGITLLSTDETAPAVEFCYDLDSEAPACIVLTGGTTGASKGVVLSHRALFTGVYNGTYAKHGVYNQTYISLMPLTHVFGLIRTLLVCLSTGSSIFFPENVKASFRDFASVKPTVMVLVPALAEMVLNLTKQFGVGFLGGKLTTIIAGGATVPPYLVGEYKKLGIDVFPGYGLTESANFVSGNIRNTECPQSVGYPFMGQELKVVDGELWLRGDNMMSGYYNDPEENARAYQDGWFRTGDLVRIDSDNMIYIVGRIKELIILSNGENVSPARIEAQINTLPFIQDSLVYEGESTLGGSILCAEVLLRKPVLDATDKGGLSEQAFVEQQVFALNKELYGYEQIGKVVIRTEDFVRSPALKIIRPKKA